MLHCLALARASQYGTSLKLLQGKRRLLVHRTAASLFKVCMIVDWYLGSRQVAHCTLHRSAEVAGRVQVRHTALLRQWVCSLVLLLVRPTHLQCLPVSELHCLI